MTACPTTSRLVGRREELAVLAGLASPAGPHAVVVEGDPGMGKSMLVAAAVALLGEHATVVTVAPAEGDQRVPWATVRAVLPTLGPVGFDPDAHDPGAHHEVGPAQFAFANAVAQASAARAPAALVIVVDDAQWVDPASAGALSFAARSGARWLVARRPGSARGFTPDVAHTARVAVGPMHARDLDELVRDLTGWRWTAPRVAELAELSGGSPLYARQLVELFGTPDGLVVGDLPDGPLGAYSRRVAALAPEHLRIVGAVALQRGSGIAALDAVTGADWEAIEHALDAAERAGLVSVRPPAVEFAHALARQAVVERLDPAATAELHRGLAAHADDSIDRAWHLGRGTAAADADIAAELERAAERAHALGDSLLASELFVRAAELSPSHAAAERLQRTRLGGWTAVLAGDFVTGERLLGPVVHEPGDDLAARRARRAYVGAVIGLSGAKAAYDTTELMLPLAATDDERDVLLHARTRLAMTIDLALAERVAAEHVGWACGAGGAGVERAARAVHDELRMLRGERIELGDHIAAYRADPEAFGAAGSDSRTAFAELVQFHDHHELATELWQSRIAAAEKSGVADGVSGGRDGLAATLRLRGDWHGVADMVAEFGDTVNGDHPDGGARAGLWSLFLWAATGNHALVLPLVEQEVESVAGAVAPVRLEVLGIGGFAMLAAGRVDQAVELLTAAWATAHEWGYADARGVNIHADLVEALVAAGRVDEAAVAATEAEQIAARSGWPFSVLEAQRCRASVLVARGEAAAAMHLLEASEPRWAAIRRPFEVARAYLLLAEARRLARFPGRAREALDRAEAMFAELGAQPWLDRVAAERALLGRHGTVDDTRELTEAEAAVATLIRAGHSSPEVAAELAMSLRSVENHLTRIYRKLGVRRRSEFLALDESALSSRA